MNKENTHLAQESGNHACPSPNDEQGGCHNHTHGQADSDGCEHGHQHDHSDSCSCEHGHMHKESDSCGHTHQHDKADPCGCGHNHTHGQADSDGYSHGHQHMHKESDGCGHTHQHDPADPCGCGHNHTHGQADSCNCIHESQGAKLLDAQAATGVKITCLVDHLGCANCAAKMESRINALPSVNAATLTFATKQLRAVISPEAAKDLPAIVAQFQSICSSIEPGVVVTRLDSSHIGKQSLQTKSEESKKHRFSNQQMDLISIITGALLFLFGEILERTGAGHVYLPSGIFIAAYLILGSQILITAAKNIAKGQVFDENFLMGIATLGAFAIGNFPEAVGVMLFYRIGEYFEETAVSKSRAQIMDAVDLRPETVNLVTGNGISVIPAEEARPGDLLLVRPGDRIPLDGTVAEGESRLDTSPITGEPVPVKAGVGDAVVSGCINTSGTLHIHVDQSLENSMVTRILESVENAAASKPKIDRFITRFSRIYTPFVVFAALATAILPSLVTGDWHHWIYTALTFLVISCPCALVLSVPLAFFSGIGAGSKKGILFKGGVSIEALKHISTVVMDKTGTLTKGDFSVQQILPSQDFTEEEILRLCASCEQYSTHPIGASILAAAKDRKLSLDQPISVEEFAGEGIRAELPAGTALAGNQALLERFHVPLPSELQTQEGAEVFFAFQGTLAGRLLISDTLKPGASSAIHTLKQMQIKTAMLTGDALANAQSVARQTGIDEVHAKLLPEGKLSKLQEIRNRTGSVMFVGDGINDAPVLAGADVGAAMGSGADAAIEAADVVFMTSDIKAVPDSIAIAKSTARIAWQNVIFALAIKALVMILGFTGYASMWMAVFADSGVAMLCVLNSIRILYQKRETPV